MKRFLKRLSGRFGSALQSDAAFIEQAYRDILGRAADHDGILHYRRVLRDGVSRREVLLSLMRSEEFLHRHAHAPAATHIDLKSLRPDRYRTSTDLTTRETIPVFAAADPSDFDWLERMILEHAYYETPGVWNFGIDTDKRLMADIIAAFAPACALELGCAAGAVLEGLADRGVNAEGVEISALAIGRAPERVRACIHHGDLLALSLPQKYDVIFGLDVFEHLNPNRLDAYLTRLAAVATPDAFFFCNVPAFGRDPEFGDVFPLYLAEWTREAERGAPFSTLHVDAHGFPIHGHLTWADWRWWTARFERAGLTRDVAIERAVHARCDRYFDARARARKAFFVFSKEGSPARRAHILERLATLSAP